MNELYVITGLGLGNSKQWVRVALSGLIAAVLGACATMPGDPVSEKLDPDTATTVTTLIRPIELLALNPRGTVNDPFAYIAPFETNRQGERALFLWVSAPQARGALQPQVLCNGQPLSLQPLNDAGQRVNPSDAAAASGNAAATSGRAGTATGGTAVKIDLSQLSLSRAPYDAPVPWNTQWYFRLPQDGLKCLAGAEGISLETRAPDGGPESFTASRKNLAALDAFARR